MNKTIGIIVSIAILVGFAVYIITQQPAWIDRAMAWLFGQLGM